MQFILSQHGKQIKLPDNSINKHLISHLSFISKISQCASPCLSTSSPTFSLSAFSKQASAAGSPFKPFPPRNPLGFKAQNIPTFPRPPWQLLSRTLLPRLPGVRPCPVLTPPPVTPSVCSCGSRFPSSAISPREMDESGTPWGGEHHWARKSAKGRRRQPVALEKHVTVKLHLYKSCTFHNGLSAEHSTSQSTWNVILGIDI